MKRWKRVGEHSRKALALLPIVILEARQFDGYEYPSNFSLTFTRFFGCAPKSIFGVRREGQDW